MKKIFFLVFLAPFLLKASSVQDSIKYRLIVSFHSECCGVPDNTTLTNYIKAFKKQNKIKKISYDRIGPLGREGEYEMAFLLKELTKKQAIQFIRNIKALLPRLKGKGNADEEENVTVYDADLPRMAKKEKVIL